MCQCKCKDIIMKQLFICDHRLSQFRAGSRCGAPPPAGGCPGAPCSSSTRCSPAPAPAPSRGTAGGSCQSWGPGLQYRRGLEGALTFAFLIRTPAGWLWSEFPPCGSIPSPEHKMLLLLLVLLMPCHLSSCGHVVRHRLLTSIRREHLQVAGGHHAPARGNK